MGTVSIYDSASNSTFSATIDIQQSVVAGNGSGAPRFYIVLSTSARNPDGGAVTPVIIQDTEFTDDLTEVVKERLVELFRRIMGVNVAGDDLYPSSSSSSTSVTISSQSGISSASSDSSSRLEGTSSSVTSDNSHSSRSSLSSAIT